MKSDRKPTDILYSTPNNTYTLCNCTVAVALQTLALLWCWRCTDRRQSNFGVKCCEQNIEPGYHKKISKTSKNPPGSKPTNLTKRHKQNINISRNASIRPDGVSLHIEPNLAPQCPYRTSSRAIESPAQRKRIYPWNDTRDDTGIYHSSQWFILPLSNLTSV